MRQKSFWSFRLKDIRHLCILILDGNIRIPLMATVLTIGVLFVTPEFSRLYPQMVTYLSHTMMQDIQEAIRSFPAQANLTLNNHTLATNYAVPWFISVRSIPLFAIDTRETHHEPAWYGTYSVFFRDHATLVFFDHKLSLSYRYFADTAISKKTLLALIESEQFQKTISTVRIALIIFTPLAAILLSSAFVIMHCLMTLVVLSFIFRVLGKKVRFRFLFSLILLPGSLPLLLIPFIPYPAYFTYPFIFASVITGLFVLTQTGKIPGLRKYTLLTTLFVFLWGAVLLFSIMTLLQKRLHTDEPKQICTDTGSSSQELIETIHILRSKNNLEPLYPSPQLEMLANRRIQEILHSSRAQTTLLPIIPFADEHTYANTGIAETVLPGPIDSHFITNLPDSSHMKDVILSPDYYHISVVKTDRLSGTCTETVYLFLLSRPLTPAYDPSITEIWKKRFANTHALFQKISRIWEEYPDNASIRELSNHLENQRDIAQNILTKLERNDWLSPDDMLTMQSYEKGEITTESLLTQSAHSLKTAFSPSDPIPHDPALQSEGSVRINEGLTAELLTAQINESGNILTVSIRFTNSSILTAYIEPSRISLVSGSESTSPSSVQSEITIDPLEIKYMSLNFKQLDTLPYQITFIPQNGNSVLLGTYK